MKYLELTEVKERLEAEGIKYLCMMEITDIMLKLVGQYMKIKTLKVF